MQDFEFKKHFRLTRSTFEWLCCKIIPHLRREITGPGIVGLAWEQKVGASLWFLATEECFRSIGNRFGIGESTFSYALRDFINVIVTKFLVEKIVFPNTESEINEITNGFKGTGRIPNVIGAIDGSHIPIKALHLFPVDYFNRKGFYSIVLQAVVNHKKSFLDICVGWPGSTHNSRILVNSNLYNKFNNLVTTFNNKYILGDGGYPNLSWLIDIVKQAFGLLKGRWRCLLHSLEVSFEIIPHIITTCCILHNICEERRNFLPPEEQYHDTGTDVNSETNVNETSEGNTIRNAICDSLWNNHQRRYLNTNDN
ncbi:protein ANTAGONIST OF LIKE HETEROCHROMATIN PROTEIN 1-like [Rhizophagus irregularis DAOM 181602=DAOM 197198]|nr:protein ANTAGONIST OF LIKE HETEROCHROMATIN PROTEIN 1-like [Rhizophagus irregularis DAOM 181602=DAOM 197198]